MEALKLPFGLLCAGPSSIVALLQPRQTVYFIKWVWNFHLFSYENLLEKENQRAELTVQGIPILLQA